MFLWSYFLSRCLYPWLMTMQPWSQIFFLPFTFFQIFHSKGENVYIMIVPFKITVNRKDHLTFLRSSIDWVKYRNPSCYRNTSADLQGTMGNFMRSTGCVLQYRGIKKKSLSLLSSQCRFRDPKTSVMFFRVLFVPLSRDYSRLKQE